MTPELCGSSAPPHDAVALHAVFAHWAARTPDAAAVIDTAGTHSYGALWWRACRVATTLRYSGIRRGDVVATVLPRTADQVVALLGVLQAGGVLLALDPAQPAARIRKLAEEAAARAVVTEHPASLPVRCAGLALDCLEASPRRAPRATEAPTAASASAREPACLLYTSGSTGRPKAVLLSHAAVTRYARHQAECFGLTPKDRIAQRTPYTSDAALYELGTAFAVGAAAVVVPLSALATPTTFAQAMEQDRISVLTLVPSLLAPLVADEAFAGCPSLQVVASVGEQLTRTLAADFRRQSKAALYNLYGPSEAGIGVTAHRVTGREEGQVIPIGRASAGVRVYVCGPDGAPLPSPEAGELYVGGEQLACGYLNQPELTAERFVADHLSGLPDERLYRTGDRVRLHPDGTLEFLGRMDEQVKLRGVRVEPGEIETAIQGHPQVAQAAVTVLTGGPGPDLLAAFVRWDGTPEGPSGGLRQYLRGLLPAAMVPAVFHATQDFPLLPSGKVDRGRLNALAAQLRTGGRT